jgi:hypothetical protein
MKRAPERAPRDAAKLWAGLFVGLALAACDLYSASPTPPEARAVRANSDPASGKPPQRAQLVTSVAPASIPLAAAAVSGTTALLAAPDVFAGSAFSIAQIEQTLSYAEFHDLRPVGSTSTVFRSRLNAPFRAALKTATRDRPLGPLAEVAAYRLARCLGLHNVPPAVLRRPGVGSLQRELEPAFASHWPSIADRLLLDARGIGTAAAIFWIEGMHDLDLADPLGRTIAMQTLRGESPPAPPLAAQLSDMLVFDYLIGNWDRWSGANVKGDAAGTVIYVRDQDSAFGRISAELQNKLFQPVAQTERFSQSFVARLEALSVADFERELARDSAFAAERGRLDSASLRAVFTRRARVLERVHSLVATRGAASVLVFP